MVRAPCKRLDGRLVDRQLSERLTVTRLEDEHPVVIASAGKLWIDFMRPLQTTGTVSMISTSHECQCCCQVQFSDRAWWVTEVRGVASIHV